MLHDGDYVDGASFSVTLKSRLQMCQTSVQEEKIGHYWLLYVSLAREVFQQHLGPGFLLSIVEGHTAGVGI